MKALAIWSFMTSCLALPLAAGPITYTMTGNLSGTVDGVAVTDVPFTFVFQGNTASIINVSSTLLLNPASSTSISITGFGSGDFTEAVDVGVSSANNSAGFADPSVSNVVAIQNAGFATWNLATSIGPLEQAGAALFETGSFSTSLGTIAVTGADNVSFGATATATAVPEPSLTVLVALTLFGMALRRFVAPRRSAINAFDL